MTEGITNPWPNPWDEAMRAAAILAVDAASMGGAALRAPPGPVRDRWLALMRGLLPPATPWRRLPPGIADSRLLGGLDLAATLQAGRPIAERGLLAEADGGILLAAMAERLTPGIAARLAAALDAGEVAIERDGLALRTPARLALIALDEGLEAEEAPPAALLDRLAFQLDLSAIAPAATGGPGPTAGQVIAARTLLPGIAVGPDVLEALCATAAALGIASLRPPLLALHVARAAAALAGREAVAEEDAALAARLVLGPRAIQAPAEPAAPPSAPPPPPETAEDQPPRPGPEALEDILLAAAEAAIPAGLLDQLRLAPARARLPGKAGLQRQSPKRGRPIGSRPGELRGHAHLALVDTLRAAAPWQRLRARSGPAGGRLRIAREDIRILRFQQRSETATLFVVDASGSAAFHRLAEAKGAVELLLADCYIRRDRVALLAFRGTGAELLLPPTSSLVRAKRCLAGLPGGGGTPMATALDEALGVADAIRRRGQTPLVVLLTDGRANIARDGKPGRDRAAAEALEAARALQAARITTLLVDTSPRPQEAGRQLAAAMGARYLPLPYADATSISRAVRAA
ncbi:magnesium chelatase subunit D [Belnapia rosea]|uniref:Protoporphyrin IX magnesium-chelatase n=1 Tax=Belnapia rosea TaxID=938405 RepID=A0A1G6YEW2_9PROT|nr:magnesium chelatase subunit D [Belnapia rosea]SDD88908.1 protoporphyrin IX magnesium-chelatase [Belnapia rosea]